MGGQAGFERRIEVFAQIQKKNCGGVRGVGFGGRVGGVKVDVNEELKIFFWGGGGIWSGGRGRVGGSGWM